MSVQNALPALKLMKPKLITGFFLTMLIIHLLAVLAFLPYCFSWWGLASLLIGNFIFGSIGINLAYHRLLTHRAVRVPSLARTPLHSLRSLQPGGVAIVVGA